MYQISKFENCKKPKVSYTCDITEVIDTIKNGNDKLPLIQAARAYDKSSDTYNNIKTELLPTYRFNFSFNNSASNANIKESTGLMYLDVDDVENIPDNGIIYAKWKSLSTTGYSVLVKTYNVTLDNFNSTYSHIGQWLGIDLDKHAGKATQQTILSYDPDIYFNPNSIVYTASTSTIETKKISNHAIKEEKGCIVRNDIFLDNSNTIRHNNISDYFTDNDSTYLVYDDGIMICDPFIPKRIEKGKRNSTMFFILSQYKLLNPQIGFNYLMSIANTINDRCVGNLSKTEIHNIINSVIKMHSEQKLVFYYNKKRKILFNPRYKMTREQKMSIVNKTMGKLRVKATKQKIYDAIEAWDFSLHKKITQKTVSEVSSISIASVRRYWSDFKVYVKELNMQFKVVS